jgi:5'-nucleotidase
MRILLTNDDGILAPGILAVKAALDPLGEVVMIAPERQRSAAGHAVTLHKPLRITRVTLPDGGQGFATNGTPTDCVTLGFYVLMDQRCDLVVSGINGGANLGMDITYSGTVAAAIEGAVLNAPSFAISVVPAEEGGGEGIRFGPAAEFAARLARRFAESSLPRQILLNVNVPDVPQAQLRGVAITRQGRREYVDRIVTRADPSGRPYYWQAGSLRKEDPDPGSDVHAILHNHISVTPLHLDLTAYPVLETLRGWSLT